MLECGDVAYFPVVDTTFGLAWTKSLDSRWHLRQNYFQSSLGQRLVRLPRGTHLARNEDVFHAKELSFPSIDKRGERGTESQRLLIQDGITVALQHSDLWAEFHQHQTEMIITKNGRYSVLLRDFYTPCLINFIILLCILHLLFTFCICSIFFIERF